MVFFISNSMNGRESTRSNFAKVFELGLKALSDKKSTQRLAALSKSKPSMSTQKNIISFHFIFIKI